MIDLPELGPNARIEVRNIHEDGIMLYEHETGQHMLRVYGLMSPETARDSSTTDKPLRERAVGQRKPARDKALKRRQLRQLELQDQVLLALKRGRGFEARFAFRSGDNVDLAPIQSWHDDIFALLVENGRHDLAGRWLAASPLPDSPLPFGNVSLARQVLNEQLDSLEGIVTQLRAEAAGQPARESAPRR